MILPFSLPIWEDLMQIVGRKNDLPVSSSGLSISEEADVDFSDSAIDFGFAGM